MARPWGDGIEVVDRVCGYVACLTPGMLKMLTAPALTLVFMGVVASLGSAFVWMFWEIEQSASKSRRNRDRRK